MAGAVAFAVFAARAAIQIAMSRAGLRTTLRVAPLILIPGLALLAAGMWFAILPLFIIGGIVVGAGAALAFRGGLSAAASSAPPKARAEVLSGFFLGTYIGLSVPAVILGIATQYVRAFGDARVRRDRRRGRPGVHQNAPFRACVRGTHDFR